MDSSPQGVTDCQQTSPRGPLRARCHQGERWTSCRRAPSRNDECRRPSAAGENSRAAARMAQASAFYAPASARISAAPMRRFFARPGLLGGVEGGWRRCDGGGAANQAGHCQHHGEERSPPAGSAASGPICRGAPPTRLVAGRWQQGHMSSGQRGHQPKVSPAPRGHDYGPEGRDDVDRAVGYSPSSPRVAQRAAMRGHHGCVGRRGARPSAVAGTRHLQRAAEHAVSDALPSSPPPAAPIATGLGRGVKRRWRRPREPRKLVHRDSERRSAGGVRSPSPP